MPRDHAQRQTEQEALPDSGDAEGNDGELVFMSILFDRGELGVAIYNTLDTSLKTLQLQIAGAQDLEEIIERLHTQFEVNHVLVSSRNASSNGMLRMVKKLDETHQTKTGISVRRESPCSIIPVTLRQFPHQWFYERKLQLGLYRREAYTFLGSYFDFESTQRIRATGALLLYLSSEKIGNQLDDVESVYFSTVEQVALNGFMYIDKSTLQSLQIFNHVSCSGKLRCYYCLSLSMHSSTQEAHPSLVKVMRHSTSKYFSRPLIDSFLIRFRYTLRCAVQGSGRAKEGFSLFGLLNRTVTKSGGCMLRRWMLTPLVDSTQISERLSSVAFFTEAENDELRQLMLKHFRDVAGIFQRIKRRCASVGDWCRFSASIASFLETQSLVENIDDINNSTLPNIFSRVRSERGVIHVNSLLGNVVDFEESQQENVVVIRSGVSEALDSARERYEDLDNVLTEVAFQVQEANPALSSITVQYIPQVGYVICCEAPTTLPDFVFQFQEDDTTFYYKVRSCTATNAWIYSRHYMQDACCRDLDESIGDIYADIDNIIELLEELTMALLEYESSIHEMTWIMSFLDCLISLASCAKSFNFTRYDVSKDQLLQNCNLYWLSRPQITESSTLKAVQARHPLQELLVEHYIPNDIFLDSKDSLKIVTGHNGSGKSVYLKMVGLLQYMAQIGSFVPAEKVHAGSDQEYYSMESVTVSQSSFTIDCNQMAWMLNHGDGRSLFLIDEFGKGLKWAFDLLLEQFVYEGTAELDGIALLVNKFDHQPPRQEKLCSGKTARCVDNPLSSTLLRFHYDDAIYADARCDKEIFRNNLLKPTLVVDQSMPQDDVKQNENPPDMSRVICTVMASTNAPESYSATSSAAPLYELRLGISSHSNALACGAKCGIPDKLVERAQEILDCTKRGVLIPSRQQLSGPSPEEQLAAFFTSINDWKTAGNNVITKFLAIARMGAQ
ncbi:DNA mismatch repair protein MSH5 [Phytophthora citrophthora]|uniref:DNA mismatch repair protein MSH5 n=1 Tax=Phytophthora citrophthora TaxID=4793 RepID=A0AAD9LP18_9STRA|nr:DNA mismatch repair protein MSH5 [Phytophthora citrophthora]